MNLFKKYRVVLKDEYNDTKKEIQLVKQANNNLAKSLKEKDNEISSLAALIDTIQDDKNKIVKKYIDLSKRKDKLREQFKDLKKDLSDTLEQLKIVQQEKENITKEFAEFKKNKFIIKELPSSKPRKTQTMKVKSGVRTSKIIKDVKEKL